MADARKMKRMAAAVLALLLLMPLLWGCSGQKERKPRIGIAWRGDTSANSYVHTVLAIEQAGGIPVLLDQVMAEELSYDEQNRLAGAADPVGAVSPEAAQLLKEGTWHDSNAKKVMKGVSAVVFTGGEDISPSLYRQPEPWHGIFEEINYNATRDVSDYLLMSYCLDNDIPTLGICRGMQMMAVAAGCTMIQDIPAYFREKGLEYNHLHRYLPGTLEAQRDYVPHEVSVAAGSLAAGITGSRVLAGCPSLHHQAVRSVEGTGFTVTGTTQVSGEDMIEIMEQGEKTFFLGLQFHPEASIGKTAAGEGDGFLEAQTALAFFEALIGAAAGR